MKRVISVIVVCLLMCTVATFSATAATEGSNTKKENKIYFEVPTIEAIKWTNYDMIYCHIWEVSGTNFFSWQSSGEKCVKEKDGLWSYNLDNLENSIEIEGGMNSEARYAVIFSDNLGDQTYDLYFTLSCVGDTAYCMGDSCENPVNADKLCAVARWKNHSDKVHPVVTISSSGNCLDPDSCTLPAVDYLSEDYISENDARTVSSSMDDNTGMDKTLFSTIVIIAVVIFLLIVAFLLTNIMPQGRIGISVSNNNVAKKEENTESSDEEKKLE